MKILKLFQKIYAISIILLAISCSTDSDPDPIPNSIPVMATQEFDVPEDLGQLKTIGILEATDADGDNLTFKLESNIELIVDPSTGEIKTTASSILDYENETTINFNVSVRDNKGGKKTATITINVLDIDDGPLTNLQKRFVNEYIYLTYRLSPTISDRLLSEKWDNDVKLFLEGNITNTYKEMIESSLEEWNDLITDGNTINLVNSLEESYVHLILGPKSLIQQSWPDMFNSVSGGNYSGYAIYYAANNYIVRGRMWVKNSNRDIFIHELGHILGLGHSSSEYCENREISFMCSVGTATEFNTFDVEIIKALYHSNTTVGLTQTEMRMLIEKYIIENSILK